MGPCTRRDEFGTLSMVIERTLGQLCMRRDRLRVGGMCRVGEVMNMVDTVGIG